MDLIAHLASNSPEGRQWLPTGNANRSWNPVQFHAPNAGTATCGWATRSTSGNDGSHAEQQFRDDNDGASSRHRWRAQIYGLPWWPIACEELCLQWIYERSAWYVPFLLTSNTKCCKKRNAKINFTVQLQQQHTHKMRCTALRRWRATDANVATVAQMKRANSSRCRRRCSSSSSANKRGLKNLQFQLWASSSTAQLQKFSYCALSLAALLCCFLGTLHNFHFNGDVDVCCCCCCSPQRSRAHLAYCACVFSFSLYCFFLWARHESVRFFFSFAPLAYPPPWKLPATANIAFLFVLRPLEASCISRLA